MKTLRKVCLLFKDFGILFAVKYCFLKKTKQYDKFIKMVYDYLSAYLEDYTNDFNDKAQKYTTSIIEEKNKNIWVCWWQGKENMPDFCKMCYNNLMKNTPSEYKIHLITKDNYARYTHIPDYIINKMEQGLIPLTQFSDILRQNLLLENGGLWIDASIWVTHDYIFKIDASLPFWSIKLNGIDDSEVWGQLISECRWGSFILYAGKPGDIVFKYVFGAMCKYYYDHNSIIDYFLQNMLICIGYDSIDAIRKEIDDVQISNEHLYELYRVMDKPYNEQLWKGYSKDTGIFKLTQKREYSEYIDGKMTFYGYLKTL
jgi:hypothetical protein